MAAASGEHARVPAMRLPARGFKQPRRLEHETVCTSRTCRWSPAIKKRRRMVISSPGRARPNYQP